MLLRGDLTAEAQGLNEKRGDCCIVLIGVCHAVDRGERLAFHAAEQVGIDQRLRGGELTDGLAVAFALGIVPGEGGKRLASSTTAGGLIKTTLAPQLDSIICSSA